jgi:hypothetical protein
VKKLSNLKQWLTVPDAARHLSILFGEEVSEADVLRLGLDGHLTLSVDFVNFAMVRCGPVVPLQDAKRQKIRSPLNNEWIEIFEGVQIGDEVIQLNDQIVRLEGVWDLKMRGAERIDVENRYQFLTGGPSVKHLSLAGPIVCHENGTHCQLQSRFQDSESSKSKNPKRPHNHPNNYYPAGELPDDCVLVVRTSALRDLEARLAESDQRVDRPIERRERGTLLVIIAALAKLAEIDVTKPSKAAAAIASQTDLMGARIAARTVEDHLKRISDALEGRGA